MRNQKLLGNSIDWVTIIIYFALVLFGWFNIFAAVYDEQANQSIFDFSLNSGKQLRWIFIVVGLIIIIMVIDFKFYTTFSYVIYGFMILLLIFVLLFARDIAGSRSWLELGPIRIQPAEFTKFAVALALAKYLQDTNAKANLIKTQLTVAAIVGVPMLLIMVGDKGISLVFTSFIIVMYREGMSPFIIVLGIMAVFLFILTLFVEETYHLIIALVVLAMIIIALGQKTVKRISLIVAGLAAVILVVSSVDYLISDVLQPHQQNRIKALIDPEADPLGYGWNVTQSKIAIGSGGFNGKGFLQGTQTKFNFVPEQSTDFIFCTIGEEHGWLGSMCVIALFIALLYRIVFIAERQKSRFTRVYAYSVISIIFFHFIVNIGMTIGLVPVIGIPLPFFSYGGSSLWSFTILLFILIKLDSHRMQVLVR
ncbi:MAG: rod shape-determining protein RodA [Bacteroidota bacterium]|nr:rod shape-determining protein RodA [Bacteroidota bacterium]